MCKLTIAGFFEHVLSFEIHVQIREGGVIGKHVKSGAVRFENMSGRG